MGGHGSAEHYILLDDRSVGLEGEALRAPVRMAGLPGTDQGDGRRSSWTGGPSREIGRDKKECDAAQAILLFSASGRPSPQYSFRLPSIREETPLLLGGGQASSLGRTPAVPTLAYPFCHEAAGRATAWRRLGSPSAARSRAGVVQDQPASDFDQASAPAPPSTYVTQEEPAGPGHGTPWVEHRSAVGAQISLRFPGACYLTVTSDLLSTFSRIWGAWDHGLIGEWRASWSICVEPARAWDQGPTIARGKTCFLMVSENIDWDAPAAIPRSSPGGQDA
jgi:hypothetical protein